jgi:hypothetical protein
MRIREYSEADLASLHRLHAAQGFAYPFPDVANPLFLTRLVVEDEDGGEATICHSEEGIGRPTKNLSSSSTRGPRIVMAALLRLTCEAYLLHDPNAGTPRSRWQALLALHDAVRSDARARGLEDVHAFLPPPIERKFARRLQRLGWVRDPWSSFCRRV